jgi:hypothetical protein
MKRLDFPYELYISAHLSSGALMLPFALTPLGIFTAV